MKTISKLLFFVIGMILLYMIANYLISTKAFPSLDEYLAENSATSTEQNVSFNTTASTTPLPILKAPKGNVQIWIANTPETLQMGLSNIENINDDEGMMFIFPSPDLYNFWMKDMKFSIDIVWIDENKTVVAVDSNISPESYPTMFTPPVPIKYVLELKSGIAKSLGIASSTVLDF